MNKYWIEMRKVIRIDNHIEQDFNEVMYCWPMLQYFMRIAQFIYKNEEALLELGFEMTLSIVCLPMCYTVLQLVLTQFI